MDPDEESLLGIDPDKVLRGWERPVYMVHEHHSRSHHFDLRLESGGVLRSWAVPKGLSTEEGVKRLAREVPDHALSYAPFEGEIAEGHYGAGEVEIWDRGTFTVKEEAPDKLVVDIRGKRIQGVYHMVRTSMGGRPPQLAGVPRAVAAQDAAAAGEGQDGIAAGGRANPRPVSPASAHP